jgi:hypothetical protein
LFNVIRTCFLDSQYKHTNLVTNLIFKTKYLIMVGNLSMATHYIIIFFGFGILVINTVLLFTSVSKIILIIVMYILAYNTIINHHYHFLYENLSFNTFISFLLGLCQYEFLLTIYPVFSENLALENSLLLIFLTCSIITLHIRVIYTTYLFSI